MVMPGRASTSPLSSPSGSSEVPEAPFLASITVTGSVAPGSTSSIRMPDGSRAAARVAGAPGSAWTRTSTPSESPTHSGAVLPRTRPVPLSAVPRSGACSLLWVSRSCQSDQVPVATARVRTWTRPNSWVLASSQTTPTSENLLTSRGGRPRVSGSRGEVLMPGTPGDRSAAGPRGASGSDWVDPAGATGAAALMDGAARAGVESASGRARAAAVATPIEEARNPRMKAMLSTVTTKRHRRTDGPSDAGLVWLARTEEPVPAVRARARA